MATLKNNEWTHSPATHDFRSDTITTPTPRQLASLTTASLGDDVYAESGTTNTLQNQLCELFAKPSALFVLSGTMGNQLALRSLLGAPPYSVLCDSRSHIFTSEAGATSLISGAHVVPVTPRNGLWLTLEDVVGHATVSDDVHYAPTRVVAVENTIGGVVHPLAELQRIRAWTQQRGIKVHLDGARLWNACATQPERLAEYAATADTVSVCMSKSLGAPVGSFLLGDEETVGRKARHLRKLLGGGTRQAGVMTAMAAVAVEEVYKAGKLGAVNEVAARLGQAWERLGGRVSLPVETNMVWMDLEARGVGAGVWERVCLEKCVRVSGGRVVVHWQNTEEAVGSLTEAMQEVCSLADKGLARDADERGGVYMSKL
ncbi:l-allo-threonine aldolase [Geopyxis carbonaria]|nr:l-allo-threonine aldolase [Geopyxis carbonaria]